MIICHSCGNPADHHVTLKSGEIAEFCWPCYSDWASERRGLDSTRYKHPEKLHVLGRTFSVHYDTYDEGVVFSAIEDSHRSFHSFSCTVPFETDGTAAAAQLRNVICHGLKHPSLNKEASMLEDEGFIDIWYDEKDDHGLLFVIDGTPYASKELLNILSCREGWRLEFRFRDTFPQPGSHWHTREEHLPEDDVK